MTIQFNTPKNISGNKELEALINSNIVDALIRFSDYITRIEVHLMDKNGSKTDENDNRCMLEARIKNREPIGVTSRANTIEEAINHAIDKLKFSLQTIEGRLKTTN